MEFPVILFLLIDGIIGLGLIIFVIVGIGLSYQRKREFMARFEKLEKQNVQLKHVIARRGGILNRIERLESTLIGDQIIQEESVDVEPPPPPRPPMNGDELAERIERLESSLLRGQIVAGETENIHDD